MIQKELAIVNPLGLHARAAAKLVHLAGRFQSSITLAKDGETVDAKSILGILLLAAGQGSEILVSCDGDDEHVAIEAISDLLASGFDEGGGG